MVNKLHQNNINSEALTESKVEAPASTTQAKATSFTSNAYVNVSTINDLNSDHLASKQVNVSNTPTYSFLLGIDGNATLNANDVHKGNQILLGAYTLNNNLGTDLQFAVNTQNPVIATSKKYGDIGQVMLIQKDHHTINAYLKVASDKIFTGTVDISFKMPRALKIGSFSPNLPVEFKGMTRDHPLIATLTMPDKGSAKFQYNAPSFFTNTLSNSEYLMSESPVGHFGIGLSSPFIDVSNNMTKNATAVLQITGDNLPKTIDGFDQVLINPNVAIINENGQIINDIRSINYHQGDYKVKLADGLTPKEALQSTPINHVGFSKQNDGSWIVSFNFSPNDSKFSKELLEKIIKQNSSFYFFSNDTDKEKILANTLDYYSKNGYEPLNLDMYGTIKEIKGSDTNILINDVTPNAKHQYATAYLSLATGDANAQLQSRISYQFVDDDNNGLAVGQPVTLTGKAGDIVNPHLSVPVGYELTPGQTLPGNYTLKDSNAPVIIHLRHKTGSAVVNTPASQADEDTSSTPATKTDDDSNKQNDQPKNNQQEQTKNNGQDQNKLKNNLDKTALADKNNKNNYANDSQAQKVYKANDQPKKIAASTDQPPAAQSQLPQTDSNGNNSAALLGATVLTGSFAAMFAMNKHRKED